MNNDTNTKGALWSAAAEPGASAPGGDAAFEREKNSQVIQSGVAAARCALRSATALQNPPPALNRLTTHFNPATGEIDGAPTTRRHLADLRGCFADTAAFAAALAAGNPLIYTVASVEPANGQGDLHYGLGVVFPGRVGDEYHMTKGHLHQWREAAEFYFGLAGEGVMLLEDERTGETRLAPLRAGEAVYVPGHTAHRTINTGAAPLAYLGVYPAAAGHDYGAIAKNNFRCIVVERDGKPALIARSAMRIKN